MKQGWRRGMSLRVARTIKLGVAPDHPLRIARSVHSAAALAITVGKVEKDGPRLEHLHAIIIRQEGHLSEWMFARPRLLHLESDPSLVGVPVD